MSSIEPLIQVDIEQHLMNLGQRLDYHRAILKAQAGTVAQKESAAHIFASAAFREWKILEAQEKATQQKLMSLRTQIDSARTMAANVRALGG